VLLSDRDILAEIDAGGSSMEPYDPAMLQPSSDRRPARPVLPGLREPPLPAHRPGGRPVRPDPQVEPEGDEPFILHPGEFVLGSTYEVVTLPDDVAARVEGKSSLGRLGLLTHATAGFVDPGFSGHVTLELANVATLPIKLYPGMKIGQFCFFRLSSPSEHPYGSEKYGSRYQGQRGPTPSRSFQNFHRTEISLVWLAYTLVCGEVTGFLPLPLPRRRRPRLPRGPRHLPRCRSPLRGARARSGPARRPAGRPAQRARSAVTPCYAHYRRRARGR
jgi:dCTP deaminase